MPDFRKPLYQRYVSGFKTERNEQLSESALVWYKYKYLPLLSGVKPNDAILDLGCGNGNLMQFFQRNGFINVKGIDISPEQINIAVSRGLDTYVADVFDFLPPREETFDVIFAIDVIEHFNKEEIISLFPIIHRSLKEGGRLILQTPNGQGLFPQQVIYGDFTHLTIFTPDSLRHILKIAGFDNIRFFETGPIPKKIKGVIRWILWRIVKGIANIFRKIEAGKTQEIWTENMICSCYQSSTRPQDTLVTSSFGGLI